METGEFYYSNRKKTDALSDNDWMIALKKCKEHIKLKIKQKTLFGAHSESNLGGDPVDYYLGLAYEKIIAGNWEWKNEFSLSEQLIRIVNSHISSEVEKVKTVKYQKIKIIYLDIESEFYSMTNAPPDIDDGYIEYEERVLKIEEAIKDDLVLTFMFEAIKEGKKRTEIAELLDISPRQFDKLKEKLIRKVKNFSSSK